MNSISPELEDSKAIVCEILLKLGNNPHKNIELILAEVKECLGCDQISYQSQESNQETFEGLEEVVPLEGIPKILRISPPKKFAHLAKDTLASIAAILKLQETQIRDRERIHSIRKYSNSIFDGSPDGLLIIDSHGFITGVNRTLIRMCGVEKNDLLGRRANVLLSKMSYRRALHGLRETFQTGKSRFKVDLKLPSGRTTPASVSTNTLSLNQDSLVLCSMRSLQNDDDKAEQTDRFAQSFLSVIQKASDAFLLAEETGIIVEVNPALEGLLGIPGSRLVGKSIDELLDVSCMKRYRFSYMEVNRESYSTLNGLLNTADGTKIPARLLFWMHSLDGKQAIRVIIQDMRNLLADSLFGEWRA